MGKADERRRQWRTWLAVRKVLAIARTQDRKALLAIKGRTGLGVFPKTSAEYWARQVRASGIAAWVAPWVGGDV